MTDEIERAERLRQILSGTVIDAERLVDPKLLDNLDWLVNTMNVRDVPEMREQLVAMIDRLDAIEEVLEEAREEAALLLDAPPFLEEGNDEDDK